MKCDVVVDELYSLVFIACSPIVLVDSPQSRCGVVCQRLDESGVVLVEGVVFAAFYVYDADDLSVAAHVDAVEAGPDDPWVCDEDMRLLAPSVYAEYTALLSGPHPSSSITWFTVMRSKSPRLALPLMTS